jgi:outer membrane protein assembly factor BamB
MYRGPRRRGWSPWAKVMATLGGLGLAVVVAAAIDFHALLVHASARPHNFHGADCAAGPRASAGATPPMGVGLTAWPGFQASGSHDLVLPAQTAGGAPFSVSWRFATNGSVVMAPAVVNGVAYIGSMDGCVYALDVADGRMLWSFPAQNQVMSEPLVVGGSVYFGAGNKEMVSTSHGIVRGSGVSGVYALDARTGQLRWMVPTRGEDMPTPAYAHGVVYEATGGKEFYAIDAATGRLLWRLDIGSYVSMSSPTVVGDIALFGGADPYALYAVNLRTHRLAWTLPFPQAEGAVDDLTPAVSGGVAYVQVPEGGAIKRIVEMAVRVQDGRVLWRTTLGTDYLDVVQRALWQGDLAGYDGEEAGVATVRGGRIYVGTPALPGLWALDAATGKVLWHSPLPGAVRTAPAVTGTQVFAASNTALYVVDRATGTVEVQRTLGTWITGNGVMIPCSTPAPEVVGDTLLVGVGLDTRAIQAMPLQGL